MTVHALTPRTSLLQLVISAQFTDQGTNAQLTRPLKLISQHQDLNLCTIFVIEEYLPHGTERAGVVIMINIRL